MNRTEYATALLAERNIAAHENPAYVARFEAIAANPAAQLAAMHPQQISAMIDTLKALPRTTTRTAPQELEDGIYRTQHADESTPTYWMVKRAKGSGRPYALEMHINQMPEPGTFDGMTAAQRREWIAEHDYPTRIPTTYARGQVYKLTPADALPQDEAEAFGTLYGYCIRCSALLSNEASIARGIGPICADK